MRLVNENMKNITNYLITNNIKPSYARIKVMEYLLQKKSHPTADEIFNALVEEIPTLSKTTVYNTLKAFAKANLVKLIITEENENRFDADISEHGHFKCDLCGRVYDFSIDLSPLEFTELEGFKINERNVDFRGICKVCLKNN